MNVGDPNAARDEKQQWESEMPIVVTRDGQRNRQERRGITVTMLQMEKDTERSDERRE